ncbi:YchJ family protein [Kiloniella antarctica]|uniref:YchJ family protein n=1 Tax=Kiloniella antarctica TaxID=1550907 RepID=A0ABW5BNJ4_9PROT
MTPDNKPCPCNSGQAYSNCCEIFIVGNEYPETAEQLMRSRYCAYVEEEIAYLKETLWPRYQTDFDELGTLLRAKDSRWLGLDIVETCQGTKKDKEGIVLFIARSVIGGIVNEQREKSLFRQKSKRWYYVKALPE